MEKQVVEIYTDGGCHGNPGPGGWAFLLKCPDFQEARNGAEKATTNNRMELTAVIMALELYREEVKEKLPLRVTTDSQYVKNGISLWIKNWLKNNWKTAAKKPVKNQDLWKELLIKSEGLEIQWDWVRGHSGHHENELCDQLVQEAIAAIEN